MPVISWKNFSSKLLRKWKRFGLLARLLTSIGLVFSLGAVALSMYFVTHQAEQARRDVQLAATETVNHLLQMLNDEKLAGDDEQIRLLLSNEIKQHSHVASVTWSFTANRRIRVLNSLPDTHAPSWFKKLLQLDEVNHKKELIVDTSRYGRLEVGITSEFVVAQIWNDSITLIYTTGMIMLTLFLVVGLVLYKNLRILRQITLSARLIQEGDFSTRITVEGPYELQKAATAFNELASHIEESMQEINSSHREVIEQLHFTAELVSALPIPLLYTDMQGIILGANRAWENYFGMREEAVFGENVEQLFEDHPGISQVYQGHLQKLTTANSVLTAECEYHGDDGRLYQLLVNNAVFTNASGENAGIMSLLMDVSELKSAEEKANRAVIEKQEAESASRAKSSFLANMSHEIRTPLTSVIGFAEMLLDSRVDVAERIESIHTIIRASKHLHSVINDILDISKIEAEKIDFEMMMTDPYMLVRDICELERKQACEKGLEFNVNFNFPMPSLIYTDATRFKQILLNVIGNAIKFTSHGEVNVTMEFARDDNRLVIKVKDTGVGIEEEQLQKLFSPFTQVDASTTRRYGGTGLGLFLSRQLAERMGGEIAASSTPGVGSEFIIMIDGGDIDAIEWLDSMPDDKREKFQFNDHFDSLNGRVLLVEDNIDSQRLIKLYLNNLGAEVVVTDNGRSAIDIATQEEFDLVLMDMQMPEMDGIEAVKQLRKNGYERPVVMLSANVMKDEVDQCLLAGCNAFLTKPVEHDQFVEVVSHYLQKNKDGKENMAIESRLLNQNHALDVLIQQFIIRLTANLEKLNINFENGDMVGLKSQAHMLKGSGGSYGFPEISEAAARLEFEIAKNETVSIKRCLDELWQINKRIQMVRHTGSDEISIHEKAG